MVAFAIEGAAFSNIQGSGLRNKHRNSRIMHRHVFHNYCHKLVCVTNTSFCEGASLYFLRHLDKNRPLRHVCRNLDSVEHRGCQGDPGSTRHRGDEDCESGCH